MNDQTPPRRNLASVIDAMLKLIPEDEMQLRMDLQDHFNESLYQAPEIQDWRVVALTLQTHLQGREEQWIEDSLALWRNDAAKNKPETTQE